MFGEDKKFKDKEGSGFFDLPQTRICRHPEHKPPTHLYIPPGKGYKHVCPNCGNTSYIVPTQVYCNNRLPNIIKQT